MILLHPLVFCLAVFAHEGDETPIVEVCSPYHAPTYDPRLCPGEVTTNARGDVATCEVTLEENEP